MRPEHVWFQVRDGRDKTALLHQLAIAGAEEDLVRATAVALMRGTRSDDHRERLERLHRFTFALPYHRESVESFQQPTQTLQEGGDCDDHVLTRCALAWSLRYPFYCEPAGDELDPFHYTSRLGYPPADEPWGTAETVWLSSESILPGAQLGEHFRSVLRRQAND